MSVAPKLSPDRGPSGSLPVGCVLERRFVIQKFLGKGGMGEVYEAEDLRLNRTRIALKTIRSDNAANQEVRERFQREVLLARSVAHPNVCPVYEFFAAETPTGEIWFLTMKLLMGETLSARLHRKGKLSPDEAIAISHQVGAALDAAHSVGVVHRDLKPGNIFLEDGSNGLGPHAVVTDFGLAKTWVPESSASSYDGSAIVGTPGYIAPEVLSGACATPRSDIYSFGVVLDEMFFGLNPAPLGASSLATEPVPADIVSRRVLRVVQRCRELRPALRFESASAVVFALDHDEPVPTPVFTRRKVLIGVAAGLAVTATAGWLSRDELENLFDPVPKPRRVAILPAVSKSTSPDDASLLGGVLDSVGYALARAETAEHDLFVVPPRVLRQQKVAEASDAVGLFGVNLIVRLSMSWIAQTLHVALDLVRAPGNHTLRSKNFDCPSATLFHLPALTAQAAANLLDISNSTGEWQTSAPKTNNAEAYAAYERARGLLALNGLPNVDKAISELKTAVALDKHFAEVWATLGSAYALRYHLTRDAAALDLAERNVDKALEVAPGLPLAYVGRADIELNQGRYKEAVQDLQIASRFDPENGEILYTLARAYAASGDLDRADRLFSNLTQQRPNDWVPLNDWGLLYYHRSNYRRAEQLLKQATVAAPEAALPWRNLGAVYLVTEQMDEAQGAFDRSIKLLPSGEAYSNRGTALFWLGRYAEAAKAYKAATAASPGRYEIWGSWGDAYQMLGKTQESRAAWQKAVSLLKTSLAVNPSSRDTLASLALYQAKLGDAEAAKGALQKLNSEAPLGNGQLYTEALAYELMHERDSALRALKKSLDGGYSRFEVNHAPELQALRTDPRFRKMGAQPTG